ncbi:hypothetical protein F4806DRAFT_278758 [Annulohypoxylon nitens]|nr:hypothetical protein F4806DRAFT_278758 [Annulohypoxylon nitens]
MCAQLSTRLIPPWTHVSLLQSIMCPRTVALETTRATSLHLSSQVSPNLPQIRPLARSPTPTSCLVGFNRARRQCSSNRSSGGVVESIGKSRIPISESFHLEPIIFLRVSERPLGAIDFSFSRLISSFKMDCE